MGQSDRKGRGLVEVVDIYAEEDVLKKFLNSWMQMLRPMFIRQQIPQQPVRLVDPADGKEIKYLAGEMPLDIMVVAHAFNK